MWSLCSGLRSGLAAATRPSRWNAPALAYAALSASGALAAPAGRACAAGAATCVARLVTADGNVETVRQEFRKQASLYSPNPAAIEFVMREVGDVSGEALDVASGTGVIAMALAPACQKVVAFDATREMLARARRTSEGLGIRNIDFRLGDATSLPFADASFDVVVSRLAIHHFASPRAVVQEMVRVCRPGGRVIVADIVADDDPEQHAETDRLEILRDPSHTACVTLGGLRDLLANDTRVQVQPHTGNVLMHPMNAAFWMDNSETPAEVREEIEGRLRAELAGGKPTGLKPFLDERGELTFLHRYAVAQGIRL